MQGRGQARKRRATGARRQGVQTAGPKVGSGSQHPLPLPKVKNKGQGLGLQEAYDPLGEMKPSHPEPSGNTIAGRKVNKYNFVKQELCCGLGSGETRVALHRHRRLTGSSGQEWPPYQVM